MLIASFLRLFSFAAFLHLHEATQRLGCLFFLFDLNIRFSRYDAQIKSIENQACLYFHIYLHLYSVPARGEQIADLRMRRTCYARP